MQRNVVCAVLIAAMSASTLLAYSGGNGTAEDPYQIATAEDLIALGGDPNNYDKHFILTADIDLDPNLPGRKIFDRAIIAPVDLLCTNGRCEVLGPYFLGVFDGQGHVIRNLHIECVGEQATGLFGGVEGTIVKLGLENASVTSSFHFAGGLAGLNTGSIVQSHCTGEIHSTRNMVGGLVGVNQGSVNLSYSSGTVDGSNSVGGLVGDNDHGTITLCYSTGTGSGDVFAGGLVGANFYGEIVACHSTATVHGREGIGGVAGLSDHGTITSSCSTGAVTGDECIGGLVGVNGDSTVASCYSTGTVRGNRRVGGLAGFDIVATIMSSYSTADVSGDDYVGGLVGWHDGTITLCHSTGRVSGHQWVGGFMGYNLYSTITSCYSTGSVSGDTYVGGFAGCNEGAITSCYSTGSIRGDAYIGGLAGINAPYQDGFVYGKITSCYSTGSVAGEEHVGGLAGRSNDSITASFWNIDTSGQSVSDGGTGLPTAQMLDINTFLDAGWDFIDEATNGTEDTWFMPTGSPPGLTWSQEDYTTVPDVLGMTGQQAEDALRGQGLCVSILYRFDDSVPEEHVISLDHEAGQEILTGTSVAVAVAVGIDGMGTEDDPHRILNARQLMALGETLSFYGRDFVLCADIDLDPNLPGRKIFDRAIVAPASLIAGPEGYVVEGLPFSGNFDGQGHMICNAHIRGEEYLGLFGSLAPEAQVSNLLIQDVNIVGTGHAISSLVAYNRGVLSLCQSQGTVRGKGFAGGLVGDNYHGTITSCRSTATVSCDAGSAGGLVGVNDGDIMSSYSTGTVSGEYGVGGFVGVNEGTITACYGAGTVSGEDYVGGLVGLTYSYQSSRSAITSSYSIGTVSSNGNCVGGLVGDDEYGTVTSSFWDAETSGQPASDGGIGLTTAEMQTAATFLDAGWDFVGETDNGVEDIWWMPESDYPRLWWEFRLPVVELGTRSFDAAIAEGVMLVDFYATWCSHCTTQAPILEDVADRLQGRAQVGKLDVDTAPSVVQRYGITAIPTLIVFRDGFEVARFVGVTNADTLVAAILAAVDSPEQ